MRSRDAADLEWPLSEGMQVSALPPSWITMIISCWSIKLLKLPSVTLTHVCGTNSHNWWAKGLPGVGVVKIFCDSNSLGWKSFRLWLHSPGSKCIALKKKLTTLLRLFGTPQWFGARGIEPPRYAPGVTLRDKVRSCEIRRALNVEPLSLIERTQLKIVGPCIQNAQPKTGEASPAD